MPTLRRPLRLLDTTSPLVAISVLLVGSSTTGCAGNPGLRSGKSQDVKTFVAVGDRPLPVVGGSPGSAVAADEVAPTRPRSKSPARDAAKISGRVYDAEGRPVPGATVRLAVGPAAGGRDNRVVTDASGGFTLKNLSPDREYTLVAEWDGDDGPETGRIRALADDSGVRISLEDAASAVASEAPRTRPISRREPADAEPAADPEVIDPPPATVRLGNRINEEDLPPAPDALDAPLRAASEPSSRKVARPRLGSWQPSGGVRQASAEVGSDIDPDPVDAPRSAAPPRGRRSVDPNAPTGSFPDEPLADEGPSPLPPAVEPWSDERRMSSRSRSREPEAALPAAPGATDPFDDGATRVARDDRPRSRRTRPRQDDERTDDSPKAQPGALVAVPDGYAPVLLNDQPYEEPLPERGATGRGTTPPPAPPRLGDATPSRTRSGSSRRPAAVEPEERPEPESAGQGGGDASGDASPEIGLPDWATPGGDSTSAAPRSGGLPEIAEASPSPRVETPGRSLGGSEPIITPLGNARRVRAPLVAAARLSRGEASRSRRPTWKDVAASTSKLPPLEGTESDARRVALVDRSARPTAFETAPSAEKPGPAAPPAGGSAASCDYDERLRRVNDFRLPALDGRMVSFKDFDSDLILLDFWGTWCEPCLKSIPHLARLQSALGGKTLTVVGIACEQEEPGQASRRVATLAETLKVNYPVLLSRNDGSCPLQEALRIHAFPTMVLLDREGRVLWRDQGATPATLSRLDRMIETATSPNPARARR